LKKKKLSKKKQAELVTKIIAASNLISKFGISSKANYLVMSEKQAEKLKKLQREAEIKEKKALRKKKLIKIWKKN